MPRTYNEVKNIVQQKVPARAFSSVYQFVSERDPTLYGAVQPRNYLRMSLVLALYKDISAKGVNFIHGEIDSWYPNSQSSLKFNIKTLRTLYGKWGKKQIRRGSKAQWNASARNVRKGKHVKDVNLWIDSGDFRLKGRSSVSRSDDSWSYKANSPAQRFMLITDGEMKPRMLSDGYSPKLYDSSWIKDHQSRMETRFRGAVIVGDTHFAKADTYLHNVRIRAPYTRAGRPRKNGKSKTRQLSEKKRAYNTEVRQLRARIECPFGIVKNKFASLNVPWLDTEEQQQSLVFFGIGLIAFLH